MPSKKNNLDIFTGDRLIAVVKQMMSPENPDSKDLSNAIKDSIFQQIKKDRTFMKQVKDSILSKIESEWCAFVQDQISSVKDEIQSSMSKAIEQCISTELDEKKKIIDDEFDEFVSSLESIICEKLNIIEQQTTERCRTAQNKLDMAVKKAEDISSTVESIECPKKYQNQVSSYLKFLQSQDK